ncbi:tetratricopeptide repeat protein [Ningiella sp. W23]|uniref:tetratricopeptide repeat protein n=1 Tax=Ningiella sp. W23 TaxID=3023715 RepID=UPI00375778EF
MYRYFLVLIPALVLASTSSAYETAANQDFTLQECDTVECQRSFREAFNFARYGSVAAMNLVSVMYAEGYGTERSMKKSAQMLRRVARIEGGVFDVKYALLQLTGHGVNQDMQEGLETLRQSAEDGVAIASYYLGLFYSVGEFVEVDLTKAREYLSYASEQGVRGARDLLTIIEGAQSASPSTANRDEIQQHSAEPSANTNAKTNNVNVSSSLPRAFDDSVERITVDGPSAEETVELVLNYLSQSRLYTSGGSSRFAFGHCLRLRRCERVITDPREFGGVLPLPIRRD